MVNASVNPLRLRRNARELEQLIGHERVDIVHAYDAGAAWSARIAASQIAVWLVTTLPDVPSYSGMRGRYAGALAQGDRVIAPSNYAAVPIMERYGLRAEQITIVPRVIDTATYDPAAVSPERVDALRERLARRAGRPRRAGARTRRALERPDSAARDRAHAGRRRRARLRVRHRRREHDARRNTRATLLKRAQAHGRRRSVPDGRTLRRHAGRIRRRRFRRGAGDRAAAARPRGGAGAGDGTAGRDHRRRHAAGACRGAAAHAGGRAHRLGGDARRSGRFRARARAARCRSMPRAYRGNVARARGNSRSTCFRRRALPRRCGRSIPRSWRAISSAVGLPIEHRAAQRRRFAAEPLGRCS